MKRLLTLSMVLLFCVSTVDAETILLISDSGLKAQDDTVLIPNPEGKERYNDSSLVWFLEDLGYTVDTRGMAQTYRSASKNGWSADGDYGLYNGTDDLAANAWSAGADWRLQAMLDADLIIMSRFASSGTYNRDTDIQSWNELAVPLLTQNGHMTRAGKLGWNTENNAKQSATLTAMQMGAEDVEIFDYTLLGGMTNHPPQNPTGAYPAEATVDAMFDGLPFLVAIPAGVDFDALNGTDYQYSAAGAARYFFGIWGYDGSDSTTPGYDWAACLTDDYKALFAEKVAQTIPEPATVALLGLGGLALLRRRK